LAAADHKRRLGGNVESLQLGPLRTEFAWPPPDEATRPDWAINKALRWLGVVRAGFSTDHHYPLERYEEQVAATGLVPEARFATWVREPWEPGRDYAVSVHRRPDR
jgi:hypothetical protein